MIDEMMLKDALLIAYDRECSTLERDAENVVTHVFSESHMIRIRKLCSTARQQHVTVLHHRFRLAFLVAAIIAIMIAASITTIAIVRPQIFYSVRKGLKSWDYTFRQEDLNKLGQEFIYRIPKVPDGYEKIQEDKTEEVYMLTYLKGNNRIVYLQEKFNESLSVSITDTAEKELVKLKDGTKAELYLEKGEKDDSYLLFWNDGASIYTLVWDNCTKKEIIELADTIE